VVSCRCVRHLWLDDFNLRRKSLFWIKEKNLNVIRGEDISELTAQMRDTWRWPRRRYIWKWLGREDNNRGGGKLIGKKSGRVGNTAWLARKRGDKTTVEVHASCITGFRCWTGKKRCSSRIVLHSHYKAPALNDHNQQIGVNMFKHDIDAHLNTKSKWRFISSYWLPCPPEN